MTAETTEHETYTCPHCHEVLDIDAYVKWLRQWSKWSYIQVPNVHYITWKILVLGTNEYDRHPEYAHTTITISMKTFQAFSMSV